MNSTWTAAAGAALLLGALSTGAFADSIADVEGARAKDRSGYHLSRQDREELRRYGPSSSAYDERYGYNDGYYGDGYGYGYGAGYGPGVSIYVGPRHRYD